MKQAQLKETEKMILELGKKSLLAADTNMHEASLAYATAAKNLAEACQVIADSYRLAQSTPDYLKDL